MSYFPPYIDATGLHVPSYNEINEYLLEQFATIYGQSMVENISTTDTQSVAIFALITNDLMMLAQAVFNGMSPMTAIGAQQDSLYKLNGIARNPSTPSTVQLQIVGTPNLLLTNRIAQDGNGNLWTLPTSFVLSPSGTATVSGVCQTPGQIIAAPGTVNVMYNPVPGWTSVNNALAASPGTLVETDSAFRARQSLSVVLPSQSLVDGTLAAIAQVPGVTRYGTIGVENPTGAVDSYGNPPHSISMVVEGGIEADIANAIYLNKTPGCFTNGTTTVNVTDPVTHATMAISFFRPTYVNIGVNLTIQPFKGQGYTTATTAAIQNAIVNYLNSLQIGEIVTVSAIYSAAMSVTPDITKPQYSITALQISSDGAFGTADIPISFKQVAQSNTGLVSPTVLPEI